MSEKKMENEMCISCGVHWPEHLLQKGICEECSYHNNNEDEVIGYECYGCGSFQATKNGFGCNVCMSHDLNEVYN